jgi:hypothetical protein
MRGISRKELLKVGVGGTVGGLALAGAGSRAWVVER